MRAEEERNGNDREEPELAELVRGTLASALASALSIGFKNTEGFSLKTRHLWDLLDSATRSPGTPTFYICGS